MPFFDEAVLKTVKVVKRINSIIPKLRAKNEALEAQRISKLIDKSLKKKDSLMSSSDRQVIHDIKETVRQTDDSLKNLLDGVKQIKENTQEATPNLKSVIVFGGFVYSGVRTRLDVLKNSKKEELEGLKNKINKQPELNQNLPDLKTNDEDAIIVYIDEFEMNSIIHEDRLNKFEELSLDYESIREDLNRVDYIPNKCFEAVLSVVKELGK